MTKAVILLLSAITSKSREKIIGLNKNETLMRTLFYYFAFFLELVRKGKNRVLKYVITILS